MPRPKVAVLVSDGFEQVELDQPVAALRAAGAKVEILAEDEAHLDAIQGMRHLDRAEGTRGDRLLEEVSPADYDALLVPGGAVSPDTMRQSEAHLAFVRSMMEADKPTFAICHGAWLLADAGVVRGRRLTSWPAIRRDLERAGATWFDEEVVLDRNLVTSRKPADLPEFSAAIVGVLLGSRREAPARA